jgi:hypothetical protein
MLASDIVSKIIGNQNAFNLVNEQQDTITDEEELLRFIEFVRKLNVAPKVSVDDMYIILEKVILRIKQRNAEIVSGNSTIVKMSWKELTSYLLLAKAGIYDPETDNTIFYKSNEEQLAQLNESFDIPQPIKKVVKKNKYRYVVRYSDSVLSNCQEVLSSTQNDLDYFDTTFISQSHNRILLCFEGIKALTKLNSQTTKILQSCLTDIIKHFEKYKVLSQNHLLRSIYFLNALKNSSKFKLKKDIAQTSWLGKLWYSASENMTELASSKNESMLNNHIKQLESSFLISRSRLAIYINGYRETNQLETTDTTSLIIPQKALQVYEEVPYIADVIPRMMSNITNLCQEHWLLLADNTDRLIHIPDDAFNTQCIAYFQLTQEYKTKLLRLATSVDELVAKIYKDADEYQNKQAKLAFIFAIFKSISASIIGILAIHTHLTTEDTDPGIALDMKNGTPVDVTVTSLDAQGQTTGTHTSSLMLPTVDITGGEVTTLIILSGVSTALQSLLSDYESLFSAYYGYREPVTIQQQTVRDLQRHIDITLNTVIKSIDDTYTNWLRLLKIIKTKHLSDEKPSSTPPFKTFYLNIRKAMQSQPPFTGLDNLGNTCYINSCLQLLQQIPLNSSTDESIPLTDSLQSLNHAVCKYKGWKLGKQQDAEELIYLLHDKIDFPVGLTSKRIITYSKPNTSDSSEITKTAIIHLRNLRKASLDTLLTDHMQETETSDITSGKLTKQAMIITQAEETLLFSLQRWGSDYKNQLKDNSEITLPTDLTLTVNNEQVKYQLAAAICHNGQTMNLGHYTCYLKHQNDWYLADDKTISKLNRDITTDFTFQKNVYICLYKSDGQTTNLVSTPVINQAESIPVVNKSTVDLDPQVKKAMAEITQIDKIRLYVTYERNQEKAQGMGHLAASRDALTNLLRLGFKGTVEVVYHNGQYTIEDMESFYPAFPQGGQGSFLLNDKQEKVTIKYLTKDQLSQEPKVKLTVIGALDLGSPTDKGNQDNYAMILDTMGLNTGCVVIMQPAAWQGGRYIINLDRKKGIGIPDDTNSLAYFFSELNPLTVHTISNESDVEKVVNAEVATVSKQVPATTLNTLKKALYLTTQKQADLMLMYGLHANIKNGEKVLERLTQAAHQVAQKNKLPAILFNIRGKDKLDTPANYCKQIDINNSDCADQLARLQAGEVALIYSTGLPQPLFQLIVRNSTFPVLFEGSGTASFVHNLGIPFIALKNNDSLPKESGCELLKEATNWLESDKITSEQIETLVTIFTESQSPDSTLGKYYIALKASRRQVNNDQAVLAFSQIDRWL